MGYEERKSEQATTAKMKGMRMVDRMIGPVLEFDVHRFRGCPKCGAPADAIQKAWCWGREGPNNPCETAGGHLHGRCGPCGFHWKEEAKDAEDEREKLVAEASRVP